MTEQVLEIQALRRRIEKMEHTLRPALSDLMYVLNQHSLCEICKFADADCKPDSGECVPKWRGM